MNIAYIFEIFLPVINGVTISTIDTARRMKHRGHNVIFIVPGSDDTPLEIEGIDVITVPSIELAVYPGLRFIFPWSKIPEVVFKQRQIDIIHITGPSTVAFASMRATQKLRIQVVHTWHTMLQDPQYIEHLTKMRFLMPIAAVVARRLFWYFLKNADRITTPTKAIKQFLENEYKELSPTVVSNGLAVEKFLSTPTKRIDSIDYTIPDTDYFLYVGRVSSEKSIEVLIEAFAQLLERYPEQELIVVGDGPSYKKIEKQIHILHIQDQITLLGRVDNDALVRSGLYAQARAFISASTTETQGLTCIESLCSGTPVIVADTPVLREGLGEAAVYVQPNDAAQFAEAMVSMLENESLYAKCKQACNAIRDQYDGNRIADQTEELYKSLLKNKE